MQLGIACRKERKEGRKVEGGRVGVRGAGREEGRKEAGCEGGREAALSDC